MMNSPVRHVILLRLHPDAGDAQIAVLAAALRELVVRIEGIVSFEYGANNSSEGLSRGMTHVVMFTFTSAEARDAYLLHPEHRKAAARITELGIIEEMLVIDFIPQR
jgi:hypothetical protein